MVKLRALPPAKPLAGVSSEPLSLYSLSSVRDGSIASFEEAVRIMARHQLGKSVSEYEMADLIAFLESLTGTVDAQLVALAALPESGPNAPNPDPS